MNDTLKFISDITSTIIWPVLIIIIIIFFRKNIRALLNKISTLKVGDFEIRIINKLENAKIDAIKNLTKSELKYFLAFAAQSWKVDQIFWKLPTEENIKFQKKLQEDNLVKINSITDNTIDSDVTENGTELYNAIMDVLFENVTKNKPN